MKIFLSLGALLIATAGQEVQAFPDNDDEIPSFLRAGRALGVCPISGCSKDDKGFKYKFLSKTKKSDTTYEYKYKICACEGDDLSQWNILFDDKCKVKNGSCSDGSFTTGDGAVKNCNFKGSGPLFDGQSDFVAKCENLTLKKGVCITMTVVVENVKSTESGAAQGYSKSANDCSYGCKLKGPKCDGGGGPGPGECDVDNDCTKTPPECKRYKCNKSNECVLVDASDGTPCGDPTKTECTDPDTCKKGMCKDNHAPDGTSCGDHADTDCTDPDTCKSGKCDPNHEPKGTECEDGKFCTSWNKVPGQPDKCDGKGNCKGKKVECKDGTCGEGTCNEKKDRCDYFGALFKCGQGLYSCGIPESSLSKSKNGKLYSLDGCNTGHKVKNGVDYLNYPSCLESNYRGYNEEQCPGGKDWSNVVIGRCTPDAGWECCKKYESNFPSGDIKDAC